MKYIVMECHEAYAILMDEESRFFHAANLHYSVGQTVSSPLLMQQSASEEDAAEKPAVPRIRRIVMRASAIAACLLIAGGAGFVHYSRNYKAEAVVVLNSDANIRMYLNKAGKVVSLKSDNDAGDALLESYDGLRKSKVTVAHELLALQIANGSISDGDTVDLYISAQNADAYDTYKTEFEDDISKLNLHVNVQDLTEHPEVTAVTEPQVQPEKPKKPEHPEKPAHPADPPKPDSDPAPVPPPGHEEAAKPDNKDKPNAEIQPPKPEDPVKPPAEPPVAPAETPAAPDPAEHTEPQPADPKSENHSESEPKPEKADPEPEKPVHPEKEHPAAGITSPEAEGKNAKQQEKLAPPHLPEHPAEPAPHPVPAHIEK